MASSTSLNLEKFGSTLPGEDRSFGGNVFYVDMIPANAWFANLRSMMPLPQWKILSAYVKQRSQNQCEICGSDVRLEAHERWTFDESTRVQKLIRVMCLCKMCHLSVHAGLAGKLGIGEEIKKHTLSITGWTDDELKKHNNTAKNLWVRLSKISWKQDVTMAQSAGLTILDKKSVRINIDKKKRALDVEESKSGIKTDQGGWLDLSRELRGGYVAIHALTNADCLGGIPLADNPMYFAKSLRDVREGTIHIPLSLFIKAYNNLIELESKSEFIKELQDRTFPKRLPAKKSWISAKLIADCFEHAVLLSFE